MDNRDQYNSTKIRRNDDSWNHRKSAASHHHHEDRSLVVRSEERNRDIPQRRRSYENDFRRDQRNNRGYSTEQLPPASHTPSSSSRWNHHSSQYRRRNDGYRYDDGNDGPGRATPADHRSMPLRDNTYDEDERHHNNRESRKDDGTDAYARREEGHRRREMESGDFYRRDSMRPDRGMDERRGKRYDEGRQRRPNQDNYRRKEDRKDYYRNRSDSEDSIDENNTSRPSERRRRDGRRPSHSRRDRHRSRSRDYSNVDDCDDEAEKEEPKEWPPCFQNDGSTFTFDTRSAMFYEPLSDFFYDPKSKLYYGNKKFAYFRYDEKKDPPFVEVKKMTTEEVEEQRGDGGISQEKLGGSDPKASVSMAPKIAIKLKTKKVKSSQSTIAASQGAGQASATMVSKVKQQQIANIGKWTEKQAELKQEEHSAIIAEVPKASTSSGTQLQGEVSNLKVRMTQKGEPICVLCKRKFPNLQKLRLHEKASELHKKNLMKLKQKQNKQEQEAGNKRKLDNETTESSASTTNHGTKLTSSAAPAYTDRAQKRRQLHGSDLSTPMNALPSFGTYEERPEVSLDSNYASIQKQDILDESNVGHKLLQKLGYKKPQSSDAGTGETSKPASANEHLRKEWDFIEALAAKRQPRYHSK